MTPSSTACRPSPRSIPVTYTLLATVELPVRLSQAAVILTIPSYDIRTGLRHCR